MALSNTSSRYGIVSIALHWVMAAMIVGLYFLGRNIVELSYYDPAYKVLPTLHKTIGVLMFVLLLTRIIWMVINAKPNPLVTDWQARAAQLVHHLLYVLMLIIPITGYMISTADGRPIDIYGLVSIPAIGFGIDKQEEVAGNIHLWSANLLAAVVVLHLLAALKHHFINKDQTLVRMLKVRSEER